MNDTTTDTTSATDSHEQRAEFGQMFAVVAVIFALLTPIPALGVLSTEEFTNDFMWGTHTADTSGFIWSACIAAVTVIFAVLAAVVGRGGARTVGVLLLVPPAIVVIALL
jgi:hypothetical protein